MLRRTMDAARARQIAHYSHRQQRDRFGRPLIEHVERVAAGVPADERAVAYLHDVLEWTATGVDELRAAGLTPAEERVLGILTRGRDESFELHAARVAAAMGFEGEVARDVRLADLDDHLAQHHLDDTRPYAWARRRIAFAHAARRAMQGAA
jgi:hypothetical protein